MSCLGYAFAMKRPGRMYCPRLQRRMHSVRAQRWTSKPTRASCSPPYRFCCGKLAEGVTEVALGARERIARTPTSQIRSDSLTVTGASPGASVAERSLTYPPGTAGASAAGRPAGAHEAPVFVTKADYSPSGVTSQLAVPTCHPAPYRASSPAAPLAIVAHITSYTCRNPNPATRTRTRT
jgi:hypothetical protein